MKTITEGRADEVTGKMTAKVAENIKTVIEFHASEENIEKFWKHKQKRFDEVLKGLNKLLTKKVAKLQSVIIENVEDMETLESFFEKKQVAEYKLLYRASDNNYSAHKFQSICVGKKNTLVLAKTNGKIVGGWTPL